MPGKFDKFKEIFNVAAPIAGAFLPGGANSALAGVTAALNNHPTATASPASTEALKALAADNDEQTKAIVATFEYVKKLEARIVTLESKF